jgi:hypothetical protein
LYGFFLKFKPPKRLTLMVGRRRMHLPVKKMLSPLPSISESSILICPLSSAIETTFESNDSNEETELSTTPCETAELLKEISDLRAAIASRDADLVKDVASRDAVLDGLASGITAIKEFWTVLKTKALNQECCLLACIERFRAENMTVPVVTLRAVVHSDTIAAK